MLLDQYASPGQIDLSDFDDIPEDGPIPPFTPAQNHRRASSLSSALDPAQSIAHPAEPLRTSRANSEPEIEPVLELKRTLSRKLPPRLTESLEQLALERHASPPQSPRSTSSSKAFSFSRKLPPQLTESLEVLALQHTPSPTSSPTKPSQALFNLQVDLPTHQEENPDDPVGPEFTALFGTRTSTPPFERSLSRKQSKKSSKQRPPISPTAMPSSFARRAVSTATFGSPSSKNSTQLMTPSSSLGHIRGSYESAAHPNSCSSGSASTCGTWSAVDEYDHAPRKREGRKARKERQRAERAAFDVDTPPTMRALYEASLMELIDEHGGRVRFGDLVRRGTTIVVFIRHWFCPLCAQYMNSIVSEVTPEALEEADAELVIIGNGSPKMLPSYKNKAMKCPFRMYTDPSLSIYRALGLTRQTGNAGPDSEAGDYLVQTPLQATMATLKRATQMPLANPGHFTQLGGEFIFNGTLNVSYTHRMTTTRSHAPIRDICAEAGVRLEWIHYEPGAPPPIVHRRSTLEEEELGRYSEDLAAEREWLEKKQREVERIKGYKEARRSGYGGAAKRGVKVVGQDEDLQEDIFGPAGMAR